MTRKGDAPILAQWVQMMGATGPMYVWIDLWSLLGLALVVNGGVVIARVLSDRNRADPHSSRVARHRKPKPPRGDAMRMARSVGRTTYMGRSS